MTDPSPNPLQAAATQPSPEASPERAACIRLDPSPSKVFSWIEFDPAAPATDHHPVCGVLRVRYRYNGTEMEFFPVSEEEAKLVMNPGAVYGYSIGSAFSQVIAPYKSKRVVKPGERQATVKQREELEQRAGRRWLA